MSRLRTPSSPYLPILVTTVTLVAGCATSDGDHSIQAIASADVLRDSSLAALARAIGDRRIVLLGENGHGVGQFTSTKADLVGWLHRELGFDVVIMESGFFECGHAWRQPELSPRDALFQCLRYPFQHAEMLPMFELIEESRDTEHPLELAGMDIQAQGFDSESRPAVLGESLRAIDPELAARVARADTALFLVEDHGGQGDSIYQWVLEHGQEARALYDSAGALVDGWESWSFRLAMGWIDRLTVRAEAEAAGYAGRPHSYYELRDEWMARAVAAIADSVSGPRKVVVWLHNDHARYGTFQVGDYDIRSTGGFLRDWYPDEVFSVGFFLGSGVVADNGRNERVVAEIAPHGVEAFMGTAEAERSYLVLTGNARPEIRAWADSARPYLRMGITPLDLVPAEEFDALFYIDRVDPPTYRIP